MVGPFDLGTVVVREALKSTPKPPKSSSTPPARTRSPTSSRASRSTCATSASTSTAPTSSSTRPAANRPRPPPRCSAPASTSARQPTTTRSSSDPLPGRRLRRPAASSRSSPSASRADQARRQPGLRAHPRRCTGSATPTIADAQVTLPHSRVPRQRPHRHGLHPGPVPKAPVPGERCPPASIYGHARAVTPSSTSRSKGRSSCAPPNTSCPTSSPPCTAARSTSTSSAGSTRSRRRHPQHLRIRPRRPGDQVRPRHAGGKKGLLVNSHQPLQAPQEPGDRQLHRPQRQGATASSPVLKPQCKGKGSKKPRPLDRKARRQPCRGVLAVVGARSPWPPPVRRSAAAIQEGDLRITVLSPGPALQAAAGRAPRRSPSSSPATSPPPPAASPPQLAADDDQGQPPRAAAGIAACRAALIARSSPPPPPGRSRNCGDALVGSGRFWASHRPPRPAAIPDPRAPAGLQRRARTAARCSSPTSSPTQPLRKLLRGHLRASRRIHAAPTGPNSPPPCPQALGDWGFVDRIKLTLRAQIPYRGQPAELLQRGLPGALQSRGPHRLSLWPTPTSPSPATEHHPATSTRAARVNGMRGAMASALLGPILPTWRCLGAAPRAPPYDPARIGATTRLTLDTGFRPLARSCTGSSSLAAGSRHGSDGPICQLPASRRTARPVRPRAERWSSEGALRLPAPVRQSIPIRMILQLKTAQRRSPLVGQGRRQPAETGDCRHARRLTRAGFGTRGLRSGPCASPPSSPLASARSSACEGIFGQGQELGSAGRHVQPAPNGGGPRPGEGHLSPSTPAFVAQAEGALRRGQPDLSPRNTSARRSPAADLRRESSPPMPLSA